MWKESENKITKRFEFKNFTETLAFINQVGELAEKANHHPDILLHDYNFVLITLQTHSERKVTQKDKALAKEIDALTWKRFHELLRLNLPNGEGGC